MTENQRLKIIRKFLKVTQIDFGASLGLTQAGYSDIERGKNRVSGKIKILLKREHNINLTWLETGEGEMFTASINPKGFESGEFANQQNLFENLQSEIERLKKEIIRLTGENDRCSELVKSKNLIIENLKAQRTRK
jgi:transcriptional regulator with XRE-family HTH domain